MGLVPGPREYVGLSTTRSWLCDSPLLGAMKNKSVNKGGLVTKMEASPSENRWRAVFPSNSPSRFSSLRNLHVQIHNVVVEDFVAEVSITHVRLHISSVFRMHLEFAFFVVTPEVDRSFSRISTPSFFHKLRNEQTSKEPQLEILEHPTLRNTV